MSAGYVVAQAIPVQAASALPVLAKSGEAAKSGPIGLGAILLLCIVCYFLFKSMSKHLRAVREDFPKDDAPETSQGGAVQRDPQAHTVTTVHTVTSAPTAAGAARGQAVPEQPEQRAAPAIAPPSDEKPTAP